MIEDSEMVSHTDTYSDIVSIKEDSKLIEDSKKPISRSMVGKTSNEIASEKHHEIKNKEKKDSNDGVKVSDSRVNYLKESNEQILNQNTTKLKNSGENFD